MLVFVIDADKKPVAPCHSARARELLTKGKAAVFRRYPFTIILKYAVANPVVSSATVKIDPGSKTTGIALVRVDGTVLWAAELMHRGQKIKDAMESRRSLRVSRRSRKTRYRAARFDNRRRSAGWLAPSLEHRVRTTMTWVNRLARFTPITGIAQELVRFDMHAMQRPGISGIEYQQGELAGYEIREYLLEKWGRKCAYCNADGVPLEVEHIHARSRGGSDRVSNLAIACRRCNEKKGSKSIEDFLAKKPDVLRRVLARSKAPLKDAAAVNTTRWALLGALKTLGLPVETGSGGLTKFNRRRLELPKAHWLDAACVGIVEELDVSLIVRPLNITCRGHGGRKKAVVNKFGYPIQHRPLRPIRGWRAGDMAVFDGRVFRVSPRQTGSFELTAQGTKPFSKPEHRIRRVHRADGYAYEIGAL